MNFKALQVAAMSVALVLGPIAAAGAATATRPVAPAAESAKPSQDGRLKTAENGAMSSDKSAKPDDSTKTMKPRKVLSHSKKPTKHPAAKTDQM